MGDFAFDAVCETMDTEFERDSNEHFDTRLPHFMFDMGVFDMESLSRDYEQLSMVLDALGNTGSGAVRHPLDWTERLHQESEARLRKYLVSWEMRLGMATQVMRGKLLTERQKKWMQTNWRKGLMILRRPLRSTVSDSLLLKGYKQLWSELKPQLK